MMHEPSFFKWPWRSIQSFIFTCSVNVRLCLILVGNLCEHLPVEGMQPWGGLVAVMVVVVVVVVVLCMSKGNHSHLTMMQWTFPPFVILPVILDCWNLNLA